MHKWISRLQSCITKPVKCLLHLIKPKGNFLKYGLVEYRIAVDLSLLRALSQHNSCNISRLATILISNQILTDPSEVTSKKKFLN